MNNQVYPADNPAGYPIDNPPPYDSYRPSPGFGFNENPNGSTHKQGQVPGQPPIQNTWNGPQNASSPYPPAPGPSYYPPPSGPGPFNQPMPPYSQPQPGYYGGAPVGPPLQHPQQQQQQQVVVIGGGSNQQDGIVREQVQSFAGQFVLACFVAWCCNCLFGLIAFILAAVGSNTAASDPKGARQLGNASYGVSVAGIVITVLAIAIVVGVLVGGAGAGAGAISSGSRSSSFSNPCSYGYNYYVGGTCYRYRQST